LIPISSKFVSGQTRSSHHVFVNSQPRDHRLSVPEHYLQDKEGFRTAGKKGKAITADHLWSCWLKNKPPSPVLQKVAKGPLWNLTPMQRRDKKFEWQHEIYEGQRSELVLALKTIKGARKELNGLQQITDAQILSQAKVIGCTTTKAAMCKTLLEGVNVGVVLVEEAAEILESHVLTRYVRDCLPYLHNFLLTSLS
jgi:hypothetical protein